MITHQDALSLAAVLNPGLLARALDCEKTVAAHPYSPDGVDSIRKAGLAYRRQLDDIAKIIESHLARHTVRDPLGESDPWDDFPPGGFHSSDPSPVRTLQDHIDRFAGDLKCYSDLARQLIMKVGINSLHATEGVEERDLVESGLTLEDAQTAMRLFGEAKP